MFSRFQFRSDQQLLGSGSSRKRISESESQSGEPPEKISRFELDDSDDESNVSLPDDLIKYLKKYMTKHISDKSIKEKILEENPVPSNIPKPHSIDIYIKELINETASKAKTLRIDGFLSNIQQSVRAIMGPVSQIWMAAIQERKEVRAQEVPENQKELWVAELSKLDELCNTLDSTVALVGQSTQRISYYRRSLILETLLSDHKQAKTMLNDWEGALSENTSKDLFGNKFEDEICKFSKTKKKSKDLFKGIMTSNSRRPFRKGSLPGRGGRGQ